MLKPEYRLVEQGFVGCTVMYFGSNNSTTGTEFLKPELYSKVSCPSTVFKHIREVEQKEKPKIDPVSMQIHNDTDTTAVESAVPGPSSRPVNRNNTNTGKVPKWFKTGK